MFIHELQDGKSYAIWIDDISLYDQFVRICRSYDLRWCSGREVDGIEVRHIYDADRGLMIYADNLSFSPRSANHIFSWGFYDSFCRLSETEKDKLYFVELSELEDFAKEINTKDQTACADYFLSQYI